METLALYHYFKKHPKISTDTRNIIPNSLFFALKGANFNGNVFAEKALDAGAAYVVIDEESYIKDERYLLVNDVLNALQELAKHHRSLLQIPIIGITGTNGKTTTKELMYAVLKQKFNTYATKGNLNNHIGVPLSVLEIEDQTEIAIIEMGANHQNEISFLCSIAQPTHGLITNVGKAHLEGFGDFEGVKKSKAELYDFLSQRDGILFLQADNPDLLEMADTKTFKIVKTYGFFQENDIYGKVVEKNPNITIDWSKGDSTYQVATQITGVYNLENILAAICVGDSFGINPEAINKGLMSYEPRNNRSQILKTNNNTLICDYYNANASSMIAALENINSLHSVVKKVIILGDMFELGNQSFQEHKNILDKALFVRADSYIFIGKAFFEQKRNVSNLYFYETTQQAIEALKEKPILNALILLKASRGMAFENLIDVL